MTTQLHVFPFSKSSCQFFILSIPVVLLPFLFYFKIHSLSFCWCFGNEWTLNELLGVKWISYMKKTFCLLRYFCKDQKFPGKSFLLTFYFLSSPTQCQVVFTFTFLSTLFQKCYLFEAGMSHGIIGMETEAFVHSSQSNSWAWLGNCSKGKVF